MSDEAETNTSEKTATIEESMVAMPEIAEGPPVLIVEDNPVMCQIIAQLLDRFPVHYEMVRNGEEAIEAAKKKDYNLILMDILMPRMGGVQATKIIRSLNAFYKAAPIVAVTARVSERDMDQYLAEGMTDVIKKPINNMNLSMVLKKHLGVERKNEEVEAEAAAIQNGDELDILNWVTLNEYRAILKDNFKKFLKDYLIAGPDLLAEIGDAIKENNPEDVQFHAHKFKSTSQIFGAEIVSDLAAKLEIMGKNGNIRDAMPTFHDLHLAYERTCHALKKELVLLQNM